MFLKLLASIALAMNMIPNAQAHDAPDEDRPIEITNIQGERVAEFLAQSCSDGGWTAFSTWAKSTGFMSHSYADGVSVDTIKNGVKISSDQVESTYEKNKIELVVKGRKFKGDDACSAFMDYANSEKSAARGWLATILPRAQADDASPAYSAALAASLSGSVMGMESLSQPPVTGSALPLVEVAFYFGTSAKKRMDRKIDFERVLTSDFSLKCSASAVTIKTPTHIVLIRKTPSITVSVFNRESNISDVVDKSSVYATEAFQYVNQLAKSCNSAQEADDIKRAAEDQITAAHARMATIGKAPAASTAGDHPTEGGSTAKPLVTQ